MAFPQEFLYQLKNRIALSDLISSYVKLERSGREYQGLCPFHQEKTPSFRVVEHKDFFHCFGCGAHGDIVGFIMRIENLNFSDAVERLAMRAGLEMPQYDRTEYKQKQQKTSDYYDICRMASDVFHRYLYKSQQSAEALNYLHQRGINDEVIARFHIGYCDENLDLTTQININNHDDVIEKMLALGLIKKNQHSGYRNFFNKRIIIPITDRQGRDIAFGGRILPIFDNDKSPKYLNSPESDIFHKGRTLYHFYHARQAAIQQPLIIAEGYMDVIALVNAGFEAAVAPLGTAMNPDHIALIWRVKDDAYICLDGDNAGKKAAMRAAEAALQVLKAGKTLFFVFLPNNEDPDSFLKKSGIEAFTTLMEQALSLNDFIFKNITEELGWQRPDQQAAIDKRIDIYANMISDSQIQKRYRDDWRNKLYQLLRENRNYHYQKQQYKAKKPPPQTSLMDVVGRMRYKRQMLILSILYHYPQLVGEYSESLAYIEFYDDLAAIYQQFINIYYDHDHESNAIKLHDFINKRLNNDDKKVISQTDSYILMQIDSLEEAHRNLNEIIDLEQRSLNDKYATPLDLLDDDED